MNDWELLQAWSGQQSEEAFAQLVRRHLEFVHASARRQVGDPSVAEEVTQAVFLLLARKAGSLGRDVILPSWLFRTTRFIAHRALRSEQRRRRMEHQAAAMNPVLTSEAPEIDEEMWAQIRPHLDAAVAGLSVSDRDAILLRYFQRRSLRDVGGALGISEDAAKKRIHRAIDKLRGRLAARGAVASTPVLAAVLNAVPVETASATLGAAIIAKATGATPTSKASAALMDAAARDWVQVRWSGWLPWMAAALLALVLTGRWLYFTDPSGEHSRTTMVAAPVSGTIDTDSPATRPASTEFASSEKRIIRLTVLADENSRAVANAQVEAVARFRTREIDDTLIVTSDHAGVFTIEVPEEDFSSLRVWISAPDRVPRSVSWRRYELTEPVRLYSSRLERGIRFSGEVRDESGNPVSGARIQFTALHDSSTSRETVEFNGRLFPMVSDVQGRFTTDQMPEHFGGLGIHAVVMHPDFSFATFDPGDAAKFEGSRVIVLKAGVALTGRIVSSEGIPVTGARVTADPMSAGATPTATSDLDGRFLFPHLTQGSVTLRIVAREYRDLERTVLTDGTTNEVVLTLAPSLLPNIDEPIPKVHTSGQVVDDDTGHPIPRFRVLHHPIGGATSLLGEGVDGTFSWEIDVPDIDETGQFVVEAQGYHPQASERAGLISPLQFRLQRDSELSGWVYDPDGRPAVGAEVSLAGDGFGLLLNHPASQPLKLLNAGSPVNRKLCDARGHFSIESQLGVQRVVIIHASGSRVLPVEAATNGALRLEAWGNIEGTVFAGTQPLAGARINVGYQSPDYGPDDLRFSFDFNTVTDARGAFRFTNVPPGLHYVQRITAPRGDKPGEIGFSHGERVAVRPGEPVQVTLGGRGRPVTGRLTQSKPLPGYDWNWDLPVLVLERPDLKRPPSGGHTATMDDRTRRLWTFAWSAWELAQKKYYLAVDPEGSFRADDVPPGTYSLRVTVKAPPVDPLSEEWEWNRKLVGTVTRTVVIPQDDSTDPINIGVVTVPLKDP